MATTPLSHFTPITLVYLLLISSTSIPILSITNIANLLFSYPDLSDFTNRLSSTTVAADLAGRTSLTLLAIPNSFLRSSTADSSANIADILRYHILPIQRFFDDFLLLVTTVFIFLCFIPIISLAFESIF